MGLDIYLYKLHVESVEKLREVSDEISRLQSSVWDDARDYNSYTKAELETIREKSSSLVSTYIQSNAVPVLDADREYVGEERIEFKSSLHPDHLFEVGYFRSSYNYGGLERRARNMGLPSLTSVLAKSDEDSCYVKVDWNDALASAKDALAKWKAESERVGLFDVFTETGSIFSEPLVNSEADAMNAALEESKRWEKNEGFDSYSNGKGMFSKKGMQVHGVFIGTTTLLSRPTPCVYMVVKRDEPALDWYVKAWEIVIETCEYVLKQDDPSKYFLHWSS